MKINNVKINFILNLVRILLGTFFLLLTMPHVSRVLGSQNLGKVEYVVSIVAYFILFSALGIPNYGVREVARVRNDKKKLSKTTIELMIILSITTFLSYIIFFLLIKRLDFFKSEKLLFMIIGMNILFTNMGVEWFYRGIENQTYITVRFIIFKIITLIGLFCFIKNQNDYVVYGGIIVLMESGSNILNLINLKKYIDIKKEYLKEMDIKHHIKPIMTIFVAAVAVSIYLKLDGVMIGAIVGVKYVGFYSISNKLVRLVITVVTALGAVMMPRLSNCLKNSDEAGYINYANYSLKYILFISAPATIAIGMLSKEIILLMAGEEFSSSILTMQLISPIIFIVGVAYFVGYQVLYPRGLEKNYTWAVSIAAIINFSFNYTFIPKYYQNGAALGTVVAEFTGLVVMIYLSKSQLKELEFFNEKNLKYIIASLVMAIVIFLIKYFIFNKELILILSCILGGLSYLLLLIFLKEELVLQVIKLIGIKIVKR